MLPVNEIGHRLKKETPVSPPLHNLAIIQKSSARQENTLLIYTYEHAHDRLTYQGSLPAGPPHFFSP